MKGIYDEHKKVYRVYNQDNSFNTYTPEQYRALNNDVAVEDEKEIEEEVDDTPVEDDVQDTSTEPTTGDTPVETTQVSSYELLQEIPYTDEEGNVLGSAEVGSVQDVPTELGDAWVEQGMAKKVVDGTPITNETNTQS